MHTNKMKKKCRRGTVKLFESSKESKAKLTTNVSVPWIKPKEGRQICAHNYNNLKVQVGTASLNSVLQSTLKIIQCSSKAEPLILLIFEEEN